MFHPLHFNRYEQNQIIGLGQYMTKHVLDEQKEQCYNALLLFITRNREEIGVPALMNWVQGVMTPIENFPVHNAWLANCPTQFRHITQMETDDTDDTDDTSSGENIHNIELVYMDVDPVTNDLGLVYMDVDPGTNESTHPLA